MTQETIAALGTGGRDGSSRTVMGWAATVDVAEGSLEAGDDFERAIAFCAVRLPDEKPGRFPIAADMRADFEQLVSLPFAQKDGADLRWAGKLEGVDDVSWFHG